MSSLANRDEFAMFGGSSYNIDGFYRSVYNIKCQGNKDTKKQDSRVYVIYCVLDVVYKYVVYKYAILV